MKKIFVLITSSCFSLSLFATDDHPIVVAKSEKNISKQAVYSFAREYKNASAVTWETSDELYFAYFMLNNEELVATYDQAGNSLSVSRYIEYNNLPLAVNMEIDKRYSQYKKIGRVIEVVFNGYTNYFFTLANDKKVLRIKSSGDGDINVLDRQKIQQ